MNTMFRRATERDVPDILEFMRALYDEDEHVAFARNRTDVALQQLIGDESLGQVWLIMVDSAPVGYLVLVWGFSMEYCGRDAFVDELYIAPAYRGRGLGTRALGMAETVCRQHEVCALHLEVGRANVRAQELYRRTGFIDHERFLLTKKLEISV